MRAEAVYVSGWGRNPPERGEGRQGEGEGGGDRIWLQEVSRADTEKGRGDGDRERWRE
jgi:hypothetical protein